jgi:diadenosine tetraphosphate (Ap4A) HIT family hydrolase
MTGDCPFCFPDPGRVFVDTDLYYAIWDGFPVSPGHALIIPKEHLPDWFEASSALQRELSNAIDDVKIAIERVHRPDGYNVGFNAGRAAGQTIDHLHVHVIPRYKGDVLDPRGGVRHVIPSKGNYLLETEGVKDAETDYLTARSAASVFGSSKEPLLLGLERDMAYASRMDLAVAFVTASGLEQIEPYLLDMIDLGGQVRLLTGDYLDVTEPRALHRLFDLM